MKLEIRVQTIEKETVIVYLKHKTIVEMLADKDTLFSDWLKAVLNNHGEEQ